MSNGNPEVLASALANELAAKTETFVDALADCQKKPSRKNVHDLRVSCRRLLATCEILADSYPNKSLKRLRRQARNCLTDFGALRDAQVLTVLSKELLPNSKSKRRILKKLSSTQRKYRRHSNEIVDATRAEKASKRAKRIRRALQNNKNTMDSRVLAQTVTASVQRAAQRFFQDYRGLNLNQDESLHAFRVSTKKLRYIVELLEPMLIVPPSCPSYDELVSLQRLTGDLRDVAMLRELVMRRVKKQNILAEMLAALALREKSVRNQLQGFMPTPPWASRSNAPQMIGMRYIPVAAHTPYESSFGVSLAQ